MKKYIFVGFCCVFFLSLLTRTSQVVAEQSITAYFKNDSVNGLFISDAYETHNMGLTYKFDESFFSLDLGIVSPDMHTYTNQYRVANRSFGEIVTLTFGSESVTRNNYAYKYFANIRSSGQFDIDGLQDFMHGILGLQPINKVNDLVRMPSKTWLGVGGELRAAAPKNVISLFSEIGANYYFGTDRAEVSPFVIKTFNRNHYILSSELGVKTIFFDSVVSADPINANYRSSIPYLEFGLNFDYLGVEWYLKDRFSLPTIKTDDSLYGVLTAGIIFKL